VNEIKIFEMNDAKRPDWADLVYRSPTTSVWTQEYAPAQTSQPQPSQSYPLLLDGSLNNTEDPEKIFQQHGISQKPSPGPSGKLEHPSPNTHPRMPNLGLSPGTSPSQASTENRLIQKYSNLPANSGFARIPEYATVLAQMEREN
jgi:hypothetical protein